MPGVAPGTLGKSLRLSADLFVVWYMYLLISSSPSLDRGFMSRNIECLFLVDEEGLERLSMLNIIVQSAYRLKSVDI